MPPEAGSALQAEFVLPAESGPAVELLPLAESE